MTTVTVHNGRTRYELTAPWVIGSNLQPTVELSDGSTISLWVHSWSDDEHRVVYGYEVRDADRRLVAAGIDLGSGVGAWPDLTSTLGSLLSFAGSYAEHTAYVGRSGYDSDPLNAEDTALGEWFASQDEGELWDLAHGEDGEELTDEQQ